MPSLRGVLRGKDELDVAVGQAVIQVRLVEVLHLAVDVKVAEQFGVQRSGSPLKAAQHQQQNLASAASDAAGAEIRQPYGDEAHDKRHDLHRMVVEVLQQC